MKEKELLTKLGYKIKYSRSKLNITQAHLAELVNLSTQAIVAIETGKSNIKFTHLHEIAKVLNLNLGDFLDFKL